MEEQTTQIPVMIYSEATPNPNTLKFVTNKVLFLNDSVDFFSAEETQEAPLAHELFAFNGVKGVFISNNFISINKEDEILWAELMIPLKDFIKQYISTGKPLFTEQFIKPERTASNAVADDDEDVVIRIKGALDKYVKPAVEMDGGNISFVRFEDGLLVLQLQGSCSGCPSSTITLKQGIENLMKRFIPEVREVVAENE